MPGYRLYCADDAGHIELADWIQTTTDEEAIAKARELRPNDKCEVWSGSRLVAKISSSVRLDRDVTR